MPANNSKSRIDSRRQRAILICEKRLATWQDRKTKGIELDETGESPNGTPVDDKIKQAQSELDTLHRKLNRYGSQV